MKQHGMSLIELMVAMVIGLLIVFVIMGLFITSNKNYIQDNSYSRMQESGRFAIKFISTDLRMSGFWGEITDTSAIKASTTSAPPAFVCGVSTDAVDPIRVLRAETAANVNTTYGCISATDFKAGTDVLVIKRTQGIKKLSTTAVSDGLIYLRITGSSNAGDLIVAPGTGAGGTDNDWLYLPHIYYVKDKVVNGKTIPTLFRKVLNDSTKTSNATVPDEEIAEGVENFQVQFGIDAGNDGDIDYYTAAPTPAELGSLTTVRINILVRAVDVDPNSAYSNTKTYNLGEGTVGPFNDRFQRRVYTSTTPVRNIFNINLSS